MSSEERSIGLDMSYLMSMDSIFKIAESVLGLIAFICATIRAGDFGGGWVQFVGITAFFLFAALFAIKLFRIIYKLPEALPVPLIEMIILAVYVLFYFISGIVAAVKANVHPSIAATCVFSFGALVTYGVDLFLKFWKWRSDGGTIRSSPSSTTTPPGVTPTQAAMSTGQY